MHKNAGNTSPKVNVDNSKDNTRDINSKSKKSIAILGDSMLKHLNGWKKFKKVKKDCKIFFEHFSGATTNYMEDYMKPSLRKDPNHIILHVGTNDSILDRTTQDIATSIVNLASSMKGEILISAYQTSSEKWQQEI